MGTLFKKLDLKALGYDGSFERLVSEVGAIVSKDNNEKLFLQLLTERVFLDFDIKRMRKKNGVKATKDQEEKALFKWRSSAKARAFGVLPFLEKGFGDSASIPRKKRSAGVGSTPSGRKPEESWFNQFGGRQFLADWYEKEHGIKLPIAQQQEEEEEEEEDKLVNGKKKETLKNNRRKKRCFEGENREEEIRKAKKQKVPTNNIINLDNVPTELPADLRRTILEEKGGSEPVLVITKVLFATDASSHHGRFSIPKNQVRNNFLSDMEEARIDNSESIAANLIEPCGRENHSISLARWMVGKNNPVYVLKSGWNSVVTNKENGLEEMGGKAVVQLWSFKCNTQLWFALVKVPNEDQDGNGAIQGN